MEVPSKHQNLRKKRKKKKKNSTSKNGLTAVVKPQCFDGRTNWAKLQQVGSLLLCTSKFLVGILISFVHFSTILCEIISQTLAQVRSCLSFISQKVIGKTSKKIVQNDSKAGGQSHFSKSKKKKRANKNNKNKNPAKKRKIDAEFKFDFDERRGSDSAESDVNDNEIDGDDSPKLTKTVAMDCEMVGTGFQGIDSMLARVSIVNSFGNCLYDVFVKPKDKVTDYRTEVSGVRKDDLNKHGIDLFVVQQNVLSIIEGRRVVGHDLKHDFEALLIGHPRSLIRDTAKYKPFRALSNGRTPSLKKLAALILNLDFQSGEHDSIEDARVAMMLYLRHKKAWERSIRLNRRR